MVLYTHTMTMARGRAGIATTTYYLWIRYDRISEKRKKRDEDFHSRDSKTRGSNFFAGESGESRDSYPVTTHGLTWRNRTRLTQPTPVRPVLAAYENHLVVRK